MKKKIFNTIISLLLAFATLFAVACGGSGDSNVEPITYNERPAYTGGIHEFSKTETGKNIIANKKSDYVIVIPDNMTQVLASATTELSSLLLEATGVELVTYSESACPLNVNYISLGNTMQSNEAGVQLDSRINSSGYMIKTVNDNVYIKSKGDHGVLWGVYEFLTQTVGYNPVANDEWTFEKDTTVVPLYNFNIVDNPDVERRVANNGIIYNDKEGASKYRFMLPHSDVYLQGDGVGAYHNYFQYVPKDVYQSTHPLWYSDDNSQLCLTAHGNEVEYQGLVEVVANKMKKIIELDKQDRAILSFTQEDFHTWCTCDACKALANKYGTDAGSDILFINDVVEIVEAWREVNYPEKDVLYTIFAYQKTIDAPVIKNSEGKYEPIDNDIICHPKVAVLFAPIYSNLVLSLDDPKNLSTYENIMGWKAVASNFGYWGYTTYYAPSDGNIMYNCFTTTQSIYKVLLSELKVNWIFDQGQTTRLHHTSFTMFKIYLESQWQWDVNRDYRTLKENFFKTYYKDAGDIMMKFYDEYSTHVWNIYTQHKEGMGVYSGFTNGKYFPFQALEQWNNYCEAAFDVIEKYKDTNPDLYKKLYERIDIESFAPRNMMAKWYKGRFSESEWEDFYAEYAKDDEYYTLFALQSTGH